MFERQIWLELISVATASSSLDEALNRIVSAKSNIIAQVGMDKWNEGASFFQKVFKTKDVEQYCKSFYILELTII